MNLFKRHRDLVNMGLVVEVNMVNQISNGLEDQVKKGLIPLVTYTGYVLNTKGETLEAVSSCDTFEEAFKEAIEFAEKM